ncbi:uncharacterized protein NDAI_0C01080 [Naumovozyma dairenensis CBS 421]|uniref:Uncharacterized protein n=1 Tax=Naumovozyma dairenensis (strain ATCC 10597 / BCRC 20456 / CBS 421 / NBRC 0211 / NRRL Y-12639) TaxID=1071378 RepID=G0W7K8_NAUDC|nr:hypothetical protein NDAI_0C01080 [Naumovozyma dairenensis CBS 421]CCD23769.1 hypothetical protein NDAI_0C01080 [Naumovozyma dairenensis CBS 421]
MKLLTAYSIAALLAAASLAGMLKGQEGKEPNPSVLTLEKRAFPYYSYFMTSVRSVFAYFDASEPITVKVAWWEALIAGDGGLIDMVTDIENACKSCKAGHKDPPGGSCEDDAKAAVKSVLQNSLVGFLGWHLPKSITFVRSLKGSDKDNVNSLVPPLGKCAFMLCTYVLAGIKRIFGYFTGPLPVWVKVGWWVALVIADGIIFGPATQIENAYKSCVANYKDPPDGSCQDDILTVVHSGVEIMASAIVLRHLPELITLIRSQHRPSRSTVI